MKALRVFQLIVCAGVLLFAGQGVYAQDSSKKDDPENSKAEVCPSLYAVYSPSSAQPTKYNYLLRISQKPQDPNVYWVNAEIYVDTYDAAELKSRLTINYSCGGGSVETCAAGLQKNEQVKSSSDHVTFNVIALDKNFKEVPLLDNSAPQAIIFSNLSSKFHFLNWEEYKSSIAFYSDKHAYPNADVPNVWTFKNCAQEKEIGK